MVYRFVEAFRGYEYNMTTANKNIGGVAMESTKDNRTDVSRAVEFLRAREGSSLGSNVNDLPWIGDSVQKLSRQVIKLEEWDSHGANYLLGYLPGKFPVPRENCDAVCPEDLRSSKWVDYGDQYLLVDWGVKSIGTSDVNNANLALSIFYDWEESSGDLDARSSLQKAISDLKLDVSDKHVWDWAIRLRGVELTLDKVSGILDGGQSLKDKEGFETKNSIWREIMRMSCAADGLLFQPILVPYQSSHKSCE